MKYKKVDYSKYIGKRFGRIIIESKHKPPIGSSYVLIRCDCGTLKNAYIHDIMRGKIRSCGCLAKEGNHKTHGLSNTSEFGIWEKMIQRCHNPNNSKYHYYGGRGIKVCDDWRKDFLAFISHIGMRPSKELTVDRINNDGNYEPGNVRWATRKEQSGNQRRRKNSRVFIHNGAEKTLSQLAREYNISESCLSFRLNKCKMTIDKALSPKDYRKKDVLRQKI